jgi:hypothetical protein
MPGISGKRIGKTVRDRIRTVIVLFHGVIIIGLIFHIQLFVDPSKKKGSTGSPVLPFFL